MRSHGLLYLINYKLFGWNPTGWYLTAVILHIIAVLLIYKLANILFSDRNIGFIVALLFGVNVVHNDVVNWGSFEGLYALLLISYILAIFSYNKFKQAKTFPFVWYLLTIVLFLFGLFMREVSLVLPFFILLFELYTSNFKLSKKYTLYLFRVFFPFALISLGYLYLRSWYGGAPNDYIDAMVQLRITLFGQGRYLEYIWRGILSFGRFAATHSMPYPFLNSIRDFFASYFSRRFIGLYFFSLVGIFYSLSLPLIIWFLRKDNKVKNLLLFGFFWFVVPTVFFSFAFSITDDALMKVYVWDSSRWRYFSFMGTVVFWVTVFWSIYQKTAKDKKRLVRRTYLILVLSVLVLNFYLLRVIQRDMYLNDFKPARNFYTTFLRNFKTLPESYIFYHYSNAQRLNDYLSEWYLLRRTYYPNLAAERRDWAETQMGMLLERFQEGTADVNKTNFIDMTDQGEVLDKTAETRKIILSQREYFYPIKSWLDEEGLSLQLDPKLHVEIPYKIEITLSAFPALGTFVDSFVADRLDFLKNTKVSVCATAPMGSSGTPAMYLLPNHLIDGNLGGRSLWTANCRRPAWVVLDLGRQKRIGAIAFHGRPNSPSLPSDYTVSVSNDGDSWQEALAVDGNTLNQRIHKLPKVTTVRYIKIEVNETVRGGFLELDELAILGEEALSVLDRYGNDFERLINDSYNKTPFLRFSWETDPYDSEPEKKVYLPIVADGLSRSYIVDPNESEVYSAQGFFLQRYITDLTIEFLGPLSKTYISSVKIVPRFKINGR